MPATNLVMPATFVIPDSVPGGHLLLVRLKKEIPSPYADHDY